MAAPIHVIVAQQFLHFQLDDVARWSRMLVHKKTKQNHFLFKGSLLKSSSIKEQEPEEIKALHIEEGEFVVFER